jgi:sulfite reductase (ferredoxin)
MSKLNVEALKAASHGLRGSIAEELERPGDAFGPEAATLLKFHGVYQQDDRDLRKSARESGTPNEHSFMVRTKNPGGFIPRETYLAVDRLSDLHGNGTIRVTTRQGLQLHGVRKTDLRAVIADVNAHLGTTLGACGDVNRNVMAPAFPFAAKPYALARKAASDIADLLTPRTGGYYEIWQDGEKAFGSEPERDPLYGETYLPRKFKIAVTVEGDNSVDHYTNDVGVVVVMGEHGSLAGYGITVGGGLGSTHNKPQTFPRLADEFAFVAPERMLETVRAIVVVQRDWGDRTDRRHARLKYVIADRGLDWFRARVEEEAGFTLAPWRTLAPWNVRRLLGWHEQHDGRWFFGFGILSGRVRDDGDVRLRSALRAILERFPYDLQATPDQNLLIPNVRPDDRAAIDRILVENGVVDPRSQPVLERHALACPALPTCGQALAEAERALPALLRRIESDLAALGLEREAISIRMTGCPNACARPSLGEIGIVGTSLDRYNVSIGGNPASTRLNRLYAEQVTLADIPARLLPLFETFGRERRPGEAFGDFCARSFELAPAIA